MARVVQEVKRDATSDVHLPDKELTPTTQREDWELLIINYLESHRSLDNIPLIEPVTKRRRDGRRAIEELKSHFDS